MSSPHVRVRTAKRSDLARLAELRHWHLAETARLEPRLALTVEARERIGIAVAAWLEQEDRAVLVAETPSSAGEPLVAGFATGLLSIWPPVLRSQRVGEVSEVFVVPTSRGKGIGRALLDAVVADLVSRGAEVLRAPVPTRNEWASGVFLGKGFAPHLRVMERPVGAK
jgi:GNAT superfamily N-acetyltransferase